MTEKPRSAVVIQATSDLIVIKDDAEKMLASMCLDTSGNLLLYPSDRIEIYGNPLTIVVHK
jgi:hypothetical protein